MQRRLMKTVLGLLLLAAGAHVAEGEGVKGAHRRHVPAVEKALSLAPAASIPVGCPRTSGEWIRWRDGAIRQLLQNRYSVSSDTTGPKVDIDQVSAQSVAVQNVFFDCADDMPLSNEIEHSIHNLRLFVRPESVEISPMHQFGHGNEDDSDAFDDLDYLQRVRAIVELPPQLRDPAFLELVSDPAHYHDAWDRIVAWNAARPADQEPWIPLVYKSQLLRTPDKACTLGRFFVLVPGADHDQWIQFGIHPLGKDKVQPQCNAAAVLPQNVSVVAIRRLDSKSRDDTPDMAAVDWYRMYGTDGHIDAAHPLEVRRRNQGITSDCLDCHKTGPRGIHPEQVYSFDASGGLVGHPGDDDPTVAKLNARIGPQRIYEPVRVAINSADSIDSYAQPANFGPSLGYRMRHDPATMASCTKGLTATQRQVVTRRMDCATCHNEHYMGLLNFPQAAADRLHSDDNPSAIWLYIKNGWMPPPPPGARAVAPAPEEAEALFNCLTLEYHDPATGRGALVDWLRDKPLDGDVEFRNRCSGCHARAQPVATPASAGPKARAPVVEQFDSPMLVALALTGGHTGPDLTTVGGRRAGSLPGFKYSPAMNVAFQKNIVWDKHTLDAYLAQGPSAYLTRLAGSPQHSDMPVDIKDDEDARKAIIQFLLTGH